MPEPLKVTVTWEEDVGFWKALYGDGRIMYLLEARYFATDEDIRQEILRRLNRDGAEIYIEHPPNWNERLLPSSKPEN